MEAVIVNIQQSVDQARAQRSVFVGEAHPNWRVQRLIEEMPVLRVFGAVSGVPHRTRSMLDGAVGYTDSSNVVSTDSK